MKSLSKFLAAATGVTILALAAFSLSPVLADSPGQLEGGPIVYEVKNVTQNGGYANTINANPGDVLEYSIELHNTEYGVLYSVVAKVNLPSTTATSNTSTVIATTQNGGTSGTSGSTTVNLSSAQNISYVNGTTELVNVQGNLIENLPDGITIGGIDVGNLSGSTTEFLNFEAKVNLPPPAPQPVYTCNLLNVTGSATKEIDADVQYTAQNGAAFKNVTYNFGDGSTPLTTTNTSVKYTYAQYGKYNITATVGFIVNGSTVSVTSPNCAKTVSFIAPPVTPPVTPPATPAAPAAPTQLVNTGPGDVIGLFGVTTVAGAVAHRLFGRRLFARFATRSIK